MLNSSDEIQAFENNTFLQTNHKALVYLQFDMLKIDTSILV